MSAIRKLSAEDYHADDVGATGPSLSASIASVLVSKTPLHAWTAHPKLNPSYVREEKPQYDFGTAVHSIILEGSDLVHVVIAPDWRTAAAREERDEARAEGKIPLLSKDYERVMAMVDAASKQIRQTVAKPAIFADGDPERTLVWTEAGVECRALVDWLHEDFRAIDDFKTTSASADPARWSRTAFQIGADVQTAFHLRGVKAVTGTDAVMRYIVQETFPPYALSVNSLSPAAREIGEAKVDYALAKWAECMESGEWPGYPVEVCYAELPAWEESAWLEREAA